MKKQSLFMALYSISLIGIVLQLFLKIKWLGIVGYSALCIASIANIIERLKK